jgi:hypothetical protein
MNRNRVQGSYVRGEATTQYQIRATISVLTDLSIMYLINQL